MVLIQQLLPETIKLCRGLIIEEERLHSLVRLFHTRWQEVLNTNHSTQASVISEGIKSEKEDESEGQIESIEEEEEAQEVVRNVLRFEKSIESRRTSEIVNTSRRITIEAIRKQSNEEGTSEREDREEKFAVIEPRSSGNGPLFTISPLSKFPTGKEEGKFLGIGVCEDIIDLALITTFGNGEFSSITTTFNGTTWRFMPTFVAKAIADFVQDKDIAEINIPATVSTYTSGMPHDFTSQLRNKMAEIEILKNVFLTDEALSNTCSLLVAGRYQNPATKFGMTIGNSIQIALVMKLRNEEGKKRRRVVTINGKDFLDASTMKHCITPHDDKKLSCEDLVSAYGIPRLLQSYLIAAAKAGIFGRVPEKLRSPGIITLEHVIEVGRNSTDSEDKKEHLQATQAFLHRVGFKNASEVDCIQAQFIARALIRRSCYVLAACSTALGIYFRTQSTNFVISGPLLYFPQYYQYFKRVVMEYQPSSLNLNVELLGRSGACIGAGLFSMADGIELVRTEEGKRRLPPFHLKQCCIDCDCCGCKVKWA